MVARARAVKVRHDRLARALPRARWDLEEVHVSDVVEGGLSIDEFLGALQVIERSGYDSDRFSFHASAPSAEPDEGGVRRIAVTCGSKVVEFNGAGERRWLDDLQTALGRGLF